MGIEKLEGLSVLRDYEGGCQAHHRSFWKMGIPCDVIGEESELDGYRLVVAPMPYLLKPGFADRLKNFTAAGGTVVLTYCTGYVNENDLCFLGGWPGDGLQELAGVWAEEIDSLYPEDRNSLQFPEGSRMPEKEYEAHSFCERVHPLGNCEVLARCGSDFYAGEAVFTRNRYGKGTCYYIAARTEEKFLDDFYRLLGKDLSLLPEKFGDLPEGVNIGRRCAGGEDYRFVMNFQNSPAEVPVTGKFWNVLEGEMVTDKPILPAYGCAVLLEREV